MWKRKRLKNKRFQIPGFTACHLGVTGHAIAETILDLLQKNHLDPKLLRGQGYDGASNMAGKVKGAAAIITSKHPVAFFFIALLTSSI